MLIDTHAHIHSKDFVRPQQDNKDISSLKKEFSVTNILERAEAAGVEHILCVGTSGADSQLAVEFVKHYQQCSATVGLHPHDAKQGQAALDQVADLATQDKVVAIGECGLDYYYEYSPKKAQMAAFEFQLQLAQQHNLPMIFHVRDAFSDFFEIVDKYPNTIGVVHSFTADIATLEEVLKRGFYIGLNGIMTFTKDKQQLDMTQKVPLEKLLLETDCPFLTPAPKRGTINEPANVKVIAEFLANLRGEPLEKLAAVTTHNVKELFKL